ncbi:NEDD4-like E3 ubiquitin-protein ligase WWP2 [Corticium candelabrum]|uniref:NEDD4-like E3 ubiquitin-protein ligase WWP2 n=1 Tax=Corticium candelabrum TaxID=121492 RepID=UPI002E271E9B|nr:NEDD4-like E3 ubiquitin-protein ligase WWP2 [Corticium candelabrum]
MSTPQQNGPTSNTTTGTTQRPRAKLAQVHITVISASLKEVNDGWFGGGKPDTYVEVCCDQNTSRKTEAVKKTWQPKWDDDFNILVTPTSSMEFRVFSHKTLKADIQLGVATVDINNLLRKHNGKLSSEKLTLKLNKEGIYAGDLDIMLDGLEYDLRTLGIEPPASTVNTNSTNTAEEQTAGMTSDSSSHPLENANQDSEEDLPSRDQRAARTASQQRTSAATLAAGAAAVAGTRTASTTPAAAQSGLGTAATRSTATPARRSTPAVPGGARQIPLPTGWEERRTPDGRLYYLDHNTRTTTWTRPQPLPQGYEMRIDPRGRTYYVDHTTRTTTWQRPTAESISHYQQWQRREQQNQAVQRENLQNRFLLQTGPEQQDDGLGELPDGWERRDYFGRSYFVNHAAHTTQWEDPRKHQEEGKAADQVLPPGWEIRYNQDGKMYFVDHNTKSTTYNDPRKITDKPGIAVAYQRSFRWKLAQFRRLCFANQLPSHVKINVSRQTIFEDSFHQIMRIQPFDLRRRLYIIFRGEEGLDYGGVAREWFFLLSHEMLNPMFCLFEYAGQKNYCLQINPASSINPDHLTYFKFIGRIIAMALYHQKFIDNGFSMPFCKRMLNKSLTLRDLESIDPEFYNSLVWVRDNNIEECGLEMFFQVDYDLLGEVKSHELKEGGDEILVTEENKQEYIHLMTQWRFERGVKEQTKSFLEGFNEVVPLQWLQFFDERELEVLLCGMQEIDIDDWCKNAIYKNYTRNSKQVQWFWQAVKSFDNEKRARLLQFVTGTCRLPVGGFGELMGSNGLQKFCIEKVGKESWLPRSHTCFNRLDLPPYRSYEQLLEKLTFAIENTEGFGQE